MIHTLLNLSIYLLFSQLFVKIVYKYNTLINNIKFDNFSFIIQILFQYNI